MERRRERWRDEESSSKKESRQTSIATARVGYKHLPRRQAGTTATPLPLSIPVHSVQWRRGGVLLPLVPPVRSSKKEKKITDAHLRRQIDESHHAALNLQNKIERSFFSIASLIFFFVVVERKKLK